MERSAPRKEAYMCKHGRLPCTCKLSDEDYCKCPKCIEHLMDLMAAAGDLNKHNDGTYSFKEAES
jgi:hypothetical protein